MHVRALEQAGRDLHRRRRRAGEAAALAVAAAASAALASVYWTPVVLPLAAGAAVEVLVAGALFVGYRERIALLALEPSAYVLPEIERYGTRLAAPRQRARLSAWISEVVAEAHLPGGLYLADRVARFGQELDALARDLVLPGARVQPASAAACRRLLTHPVESPLYNPKLPADDLRVAVRRIRAGIDVA